MSTQVRVGRLVVRGTPGGRLGRDVVARNRAESMVGDIADQEAGPEPRSVLIVRQLSWPVGMPATAARAALAEIRRTATRPASGEPAGTGCAAVVFPDEIVLLTCLTSDILAGQADRWYWRAILGAAVGTPGELLATQWLDRVRWVPAVVTRLSRAQAVSAINLLGPLRAQRILDALLCEYIPIAGTVGTWGNPAAQPSGASEPARGPREDGDRPTGTPASAGSEAPQPPWHPHQLGPLPLAAPSQALLGVALILGHNPERARDERLVGQVDQWLRFHKDRTPPQSHPTGRNRAGPTTAAGQPHGAGRPPSDPFPNPSAEDSTDAGPIAAPAQARTPGSLADLDHTNAPPSPSIDPAAPGMGAPGSPDPASPAAGPPASRAVQVAAPPPTAAALREAEPRPEAAEPGPDRGWSSGLTVRTGLASAFYLVNLLAWLDRRDDDPAGWPLVWALAWGLLPEDLAAEEDPLWPLLRELSRPAPVPVEGPVETEVLEPAEGPGPRQAQPPGRETQPPGTETLPPGRETQPPGRGTQPPLAGADPDLICRARDLLAALEVPARALAQPGRVVLTRTHLDVILDIERIDLAIRRAGLDRDPGWVPELGRVISFHFEGG